MVKHLTKLTQKRDNNNVYNGDLHSLIILILASCITVSILDNH